MASKKMVKRRVSGPTQAEDARARKQVMLRLSAEELAYVNLVAERWGISRSDAVARLALEETQRHAKRKDAHMIEWNQVKQGNVHVSDGVGVFWATFPDGTTAQEALDEYMSTADYDGAGALR